MDDRLANWWVHDMIVERLKGSGGYQDEFDPPVPIRGFYDGGKRLVRNSDGDQVVAAATAFFPVATSSIPPGSLITAPVSLGGRKGKVIQATKHEAGNLPVPAHMEAVLE